MVNNSKKYSTTIKLIFKFSFNHGQYKTIAFCSFCTMLYVFGTIQNFVEFQIYDASIADNYIASCAVPNSMIVRCHCCQFSTHKYHLHVIPLSWCTVLAMLRVYYWLISVDSPANRALNKQFNCPLL